MNRELARSVKRSFPPSREHILKEERRTIVWSHRPDDASEVVVKLYRHRGLWNTIRGRMTRFRVEREHLTLRHLEQYGVPCTRSLGWHAGRSPTQGFFELLVTESVPRAVDLDSWLAECGSPDVLSSAFASVRRMHDAGVLHQSLATRNLLVRQRPETAPDCLVMDVATARLFPFSVAGRPLALRDLADLVFELGRHQLTPDTLPLEAYGMGPQIGTELKRYLREHPRGKARRRLRDLDARVRLLAARVSGQRSTDEPKRGWLPR